MIFSFTKRISLIFGLVFFAIAQAVAQPVRLTTNTGEDLFPAWDPASDTIAYARSVAAGGSGVPFNIWQVNANVPGETLMAAGPEDPWGIAWSLSWIGSSGFLMTFEQNVEHEYLSFDTKEAPYTREIFDGSDAENIFTRKLFVNGESGGGWINVSRNGLMALWRSSDAGQNGTQQIRVAPVASLTGQDASLVGVACLSIIDSLEAYLLAGAALSPDGSQFVVALPATTFPFDFGPAFGPNDLWRFNSDCSGTPLNISNEAVSGVNSAAPSYSPDGTRIMYSRLGTAAGSTYDLYEIDPDGANKVQITNSPGFGEYEASYAPNGLRVAFRGQHAQGMENMPPALPPGETTNANIYVMNITPGCFPSSLDSDSDGTPDCAESCPQDPGKTVPGTCGCGVPDADADADGVFDCVDRCSADPGKTAPGTCGCGVSDSDSDGDGTLDCNDLCANDPNKIAPGDCGCGLYDNNNGINVFSCLPLPFLEDNTQITEPPEVLISFDAEGRVVVTIKFAPFAGAWTFKRIRRKKKGAATIQEYLLEAVLEADAARVRKKSKVKLRYQLQVSAEGGRKRDGLRKITKKNTYSTKRLNPGNYSAKYRVLGTKNGRNVIRSNYSPAREFTVPTR